MFLNIFVGWWQNTAQGQMDKIYCAVSPAFRQKNRRRSRVSDPSQ